MFLNSELRNYCTFSLAYSISETIPKQANIIENLKIMVHHIVLLWWQPNIPIALGWTSRFPNLDEKVLIYLKIITHYFICGHKSPPYKFSIPWSVAISIRFIIPWHFPSPSDFKLLEQYNSGSWCTLFRWSYVLLIFVVAIAYQCTIH